MRLSQAVYEAGSRCWLQLSGKGKNSDEPPYLLRLEATVILVPGKTPLQGNLLLYNSARFAEGGMGKLTFPPNFTWVEPLLDLDHQGKVIFHMSVNPLSPLSSKIELEHPV